ncbi:MAG: site-specific integrase [Ardenticatenaceae bacterium]|nr:site-specific integrase [Ardenticatenaceae bacterium]
MPQKDKSLSLKSGRGTAVALPLDVAEQANAAASAHLFDDYHARRAPRTVATQRAALQLWVTFLHQVGAADSLLSSAVDWAEVQDIRPFEEYAEAQDIPLPLVCAASYCQHVPTAWAGVTWGVVDGFVKWMLTQGYSIASVNNRLAAVRVYVKLAAKAGAISLEEKVRILDVSGYGQTEGKRVDQRRAKTRVGHKKEDAVVLTEEQARRLKHNHQNTPQGIRDRLLICLLLDLGIRASEAAGLNCEDVNVMAGTIRVYRIKTDTTDVMAMTSDITLALSAYRPYMRRGQPLLRSSLKNGKLANRGLTPRAIGYRVKELGATVVDEWDLSPHDLRHTWATHAAKETNPFILRDAGGWSNMQTPSRYVEKNKVVNEGVKLRY